MRDHLAIGRTIARLRVKHGLSQEELARDLQLAGLDVSRDMIMNIERGRTGLSLSVLAQIAVVLGEEEFEFSPSPSTSRRGGPAWLECRVTVVVHHHHRRHPPHNRRRRHQKGRPRTPGRPSRYSHWGEAP